MTTGGHTKVSDLGLAGFWATTTSTIPALGQSGRHRRLSGPRTDLTPKDVTAATDVYALGCTLYYAVTGKVPFPGGTCRRKARRHCEEAPLNPKRINPTLSDEFVDVIAAMMEKDPQRADPDHRRGRRATPALGRRSGRHRMPKSRPAPLRAMPGSRCPSRWPIRSRAFSATRSSRATTARVSFRSRPIGWASRPRKPCPIWAAGPATSEAGDFSLSLVLLLLVPLLLAVPGCWWSTCCWSCSGSGPLWSWADRQRVQLPTGRHLWARRALRLTFPRRPFLQWRIVKFRRRPEMQLCRVPVGQSSRRSPRCRRALRTESKLALHRAMVIALIIAIVPDLLLREQRHQSGHAPAAARHPLARGRNQARAAGRAANGRPIRRPRTEPGRSGAGR